MVRVAFQVRVHPRDIKIGRETIGLGLIEQLDHPISNNTIEWSTEVRDGVIPVALLIKVEEHKGNNHHFASPFYYAFMLLLLFLQLLQSFQFCRN